MLPTIFFIWIGSIIPSVYIKKLATAPYNYQLLDENILLVYKHKFET